MKKNNENVNKRNNLEISINKFIDINSSTFGESNNNNNNTLKSISNDDEVLTLGNSSINNDDNNNNLINLINLIYNY